MGDPRCSPDSDLMDFASAPDPGPILVGVERSERSRDAVALARKLARAAGTRLILASVYPRTGVRSARAERPRGAGGARPRRRSNGSPARSTASTPNCARSRARRSRAASSRWPRTRTRSPSWSGRPIAARSAGSCPAASERACSTARRARSPWRPSGYWDQGHAPIRRIGVGYVGTPEGGEALEAALGLARAAGATVRVLSVVEPVVATGALPLELGYVEREERARADLTDRLAGASIASLRRSEISARSSTATPTTSWPGSRLSVDLLVCGSRGPQPARRCACSGASQRACCARRGAPSWSSRAAPATASPRSGSQRRRLA